MTKNPVIVNRQHRGNGIPYWMATRGWVPVGLCNQISPDPVRPCDHFGAAGRTADALYLRPLLPHPHLRFLMRPNCRGGLR